MEKKVEELLTRKADGEGSHLVPLLTFPPHRPHQESSFFEYFILRGIKLHALQRDSLDGNGNLAVGAIAALVDEIGAAAIHREGLAMDVSVDMSISYLSPARINLSFREVCDELELIKGVNRMLKEEFWIQFECNNHSYLFDQLSADMQDELEIVSRFLGNRGSYYGTSVVMRNKVTGEVVAEGRHSLFRKPASKM